MMKLLLDRGAQVNAKETLRGTTALMWASDQGHADAVKLLLDRGADSTARSNPAARACSAPRSPSLARSSTDSVVSQSIHASVTETPYLSSFLSLGIGWAPAKRSPTRCATSRRWRRR